MTNEPTIDRWLEGYVEAWRSDDPDVVAALFTDDARYFTAPYRTPIEGRDAIVRWWVEQGDSKLDWSFEREVLATDGEVNVVSGTTHYPPEDDKPAKTYSNLWVIRLAADGRAREFTEYWMLVPPKLESS